jgi:hypothetical protein
VRRFDRQHSHAGELHADACDTGRELTIKQNRMIWYIPRMNLYKIPQEVLDMKLKKRLRSRWEQQLIKNVTLKEG